MWQKQKARQTRKASRDLLPAMVGVVMVGVVTMIAIEVDVGRRVLPWQ
jgi:hypothetical protein